MDSEELVDRLIQAGVLMENERGGGVALANEFRAAVDERLERADELLAPPDCPTPIADEPELLAIYRLAQDALENIGTTDLARVTLLVEQLRRGFPSTGGVPDGFMPVYGDLLPVYAELHTKVVVYVWDEDCEPCDLMCEELATLAGDVDDQTALLAVFGPRNADFLYEKYGVKGAPTTMLLLDGRVDVRLFGVKPLDEVRNQLAVLDELRTAE